MAEEELTESQLRQLESLLQELQEQLRGAIDTGADTVKPVLLDQAAVGRLSRMDAMQQQAMAKATRSQLELRLTLVRAALRNLELNDDYGDCRECGECIGFKRLSVQPEAPFCLSCQTAKERG
jgi:DnaK suppressor protein